MNMKQLWEEMLRRNHWSSIENPIRAHATVTKDIHLEGKKVISKGDRVNVVMASTFGDVGITKRPGATSGYEARVQCVDTRLESGIELKAQGRLLIDILVIEGNKDT